MWAKNAITPGVQAFIRPEKSTPRPWPPYTGMGSIPASYTASHAITDTAFDLIITVCDQAAGETCPIFPGQPQKRHWSIPDPAKASGTEADIQVAFDQAFFLLKEKIEGFLT